MSRIRVTSAPCCGSLSLSGMSDAPWLSSDCLFDGGRVAPPVSWRWTIPRLGDIIEASSASGQSSLTPLWARFDEQGGDS